jgi:hypothetical protein
MDFQKITIEILISELGELPSDWMDPTAHKLVQLLMGSVARLKRLKRPVSTEDLTSLLEEAPTFLDVCRLFLGKGQETVGLSLCQELGITPVNWARLRSMAKSDPARMAQALTALGCVGTINEQIHKKWRVEDVLIERYKMSRGRAIAGQKRGRGLEDEVQAVLRGMEIPFERGVTFTGRKGATAKCDFAIPNRKHPKIVMEVKGFEATGSKLTDFLGDVLKIGQAKDYHMYFFLITDGRGWFSRKSDLKKLVEFHREGLIDMIYTRARLNDLAESVRHIHQNE